MKKSIELDFNIKKARKSIFSTIFLSCILSSIILFTNNKISSFLEDNIYFALFFVGVYLLILAMMMGRLFLFYKNKLNISINHKSALIPNIYLGKKSFNFKDMFSVEYLVVNKKNVGIILGIRKKSRYLIDKNVFLSDGDLNVFFENLKKKVNGMNHDEVTEVFGALSKTQSINKSIAVNLIATILIICYCISLFASGANKPNEEFLLLAANTKELVSNHEFYRIFSSFLFHTRPYHLMLNILVLGFLGPVLERIFSSIRISNIILLSSISAVFFSNYFSGFDASIGASGGVFGLWGAFACLKFQYEKFLPASVNLIPSFRLTILLVSELLLEIFWLTSVDYFAHIGGFIAGFAYLYFAPLGPKLEKVDQPTLIEKNLSVILILGYSTGLVYFLLLYQGLI